MLTSHIKKKRKNDHVLFSAGRFVGGINFLKSLALITRRIPRWLVTRAQPAPCQRSNWRRVIYTRRLVKATVWLTAQ